MEDAHFFYGGGDDECASPDVATPKVAERLGEEDWQGYFEEELLDLYDRLTSMHRRGGWPIFDSLTFPEFAEFAWRHSSKYPCAR